jgi:hypothetical protein
MQTILVQNQNGSLTHNISRAANVLNAGYHYVSCSGNTVCQNPILILYKELSTCYYCIPLYYTEHVSCVHSSQSGFMQS